MQADSRGALSRCYFYYIVGLFGYLLEAIGGRLSSAVKAGIVFDRTVRALFAIGFTWMGGSIRSQAPDIEDKTQVDLKLAPSCCAQARFAKRDRRSAR